MYFILSLLPISLRVFFLQQNAVHLNITYICIKYILQILKLSKREKHIEKGTLGRFPFPSKTWQGAVIPQITWLFLFRINICNTTCKGQLASKLKNKNVARTFHRSGKGNKKRAASASTSAPHRGRQEHSNFEFIPIWKSNGTHRDASILRLKNFFLNWRSKFNF